MSSAATNESIDKELASMNAENHEAILDAYLADTIDFDEAFNKIVQIHEVESKLT